MPSQVTLKTIVEATGGKLYGDENIPVTDVTHNSRQAGTGVLFVAIRGALFDAHKFVPQVIEQGAVGVISEQEPLDNFQRAWLQVAHSNDALAGGHRGTYAQLGVRVPLNERVRLEAAVGQYWLATAQGPDYLHGQLSAIATLTPAWELRATVHDTDSAAKRLFPGNAGGRWELALQGSF